MKNKLLFSVLFLSLAFSVAMPQNLRLSSMGNISLAMKDSEFSFNPYDMGGNISFLFLDEGISTLKITPSFNSNWGEYKRLYDAKTNDLYSMNFTGIKTLGSEGTFIGNVSYIYDSRIDMNRSVKYDTYGGEAFFINDSTMGNSRFTGPAVNFGYSFELAPDLYLGASAGYKILNGLKKIYSQTSTVLRNIDASIGLTYRIADDLYVAGSADIFNSQESLTAALSNPVDVEIQNYHGDNFALTKRGSDIPEKIKSVGYDFKTQLYYKDEDKEAGLNFIYGNSNKKFLFSTTVNNVSVTEFEDGYSAFNNYSVEFNGRYDVNSSMTLGLTGGYNYNRSWSKLSSKELVVWDWNVKTIYAGTGASYKFNDNVSAGIQYNFENIQLDSAKYIDFHYVNSKGNNHVVRIGAEVEALRNVFVRAGAGYGKKETDLLFGGKNVNFTMFSFGLGINVFEMLTLDFYTGYNIYKPKDSVSARKFFDGLVTIKFFNI